MERNYVYFYGFDNETAVSVYLHSETDLKLENSFFNVIYFFI